MTGGNETFDVIDLSLQFFFEGYFLVGTVGGVPSKLDRAIYSISCVACILFNSFITEENP